MVEVAGELVVCTFRVSARAQHMRLEVAPVDGLTVVIPLWADRADAEAFVRANGRWILRHLDRVAGQPRLPKPVELRDGALVLFRGVPRTLRVAADTSLRRARVELSGDELHVRAPRVRKSDLRAALEGWMRAQARALVQADLEALDPGGELRRGRLYIMDQRTRWGSCSARGNLTFSWRLAMAPAEALRYIVAHELAHLVHHNHSRRFWDLVRRLVGDYEEPRAWLERHGRELRF
jgi:hypothetical protein